MILSFTFLKFHYNSVSARSHGPFFLLPILILLASICSYVWILHFQSTFYNLVGMFIT